MITETAKPEWVDGPSVVATNGRGNTMMSSED